MLSVRNCVQSQQAWSGTDVECVGGRGVGGVLTVMLSARRWNVFQKNFVDGCVY